jgi:hypothetical protein
MLVYIATGGFQMALTAHRLHKQLLESDFYNDEKSC